MLKIIALTILTIITINPVNGQFANPPDSTLLESQRVKTKIGGELKGMNIAGLTAIISGAGLGYAVGLVTDNGRVAAGSSVVAAGLAAAPASLVGLGLGSLLAKKHSRVSGRYAFAIGVTFTPVFKTYPPFPFGKQLEGQYIPGLNIRLLSPEVGRWRYNIGLNHFFQRFYELDHGDVEISWQSANLDVQYLFDLNETFTVYPLVGTQYHHFLKKELYTNFGAGINIEFIEGWRVYGEVKWSLDPDQTFNQTNYSFGMMMYLGK